jgi:hypothetical protein
MLAACQMVLERNSLTSRRYQLDCSAPGERELTGASRTWAWLEGYEQNRFRHRAHWQYVVGFNGNSAG